MVQYDFMDESAESYGNELRNWLSRNPPGSPSACELFSSSRTAKKLSEAFTKLSLRPFSEREQLLTDPPSPLIYVILSPEIEVLEDHSTNNSDEINDRRIAIATEIKPWIKTLMPRRVLVPLVSVKDDKFRTITITPCENHVCKYLLIPLTTLSYWPAQSKRVPWHPGLPVLVELVIPPRLNMQNRIYE
ncbi:predicted protein [Histoplasma capsulatum var. duboisii H88]|uniref:Predicted protein n=1 Tax=Ajellomyces capsulatus (strain H88) TaxID=544711 RepID=F0UN68_AJEC8|nr:predicted protein [Histoplasma capsulatum var. duboisii H88]